MAPSVYYHTEALVSWLRSAGLTTGNHSGEGLTPPFVVVYLVGGGDVDGPISDPDTDGQLVWQLTSVGAGIEQALYTHDLALASVLGQTLTVTGRRVEPIRLVAAQGFATRDDDVTPPVFYTIDRVSAWSYPT